MGSEEAVRLRAVLDRMVKEKEIAFSAGSHNEVIRLPYEDFDRLVKPKVLRFVAGKAHAA